MYVGKLINQYRIPIKQPVFVARVFELTAARSFVLVCFFLVVSSGKVIQMFVSTKKVSESIDFISKKVGPSRRGLVINCETLRVW